ncbi:MAG: family 10 glycosylhydrolase [Hymenobacteraceae bacterium]|nr:family 10 glycosylhydrolase [Hymenobacteraceae bacterium]
MCFSFRLLVGVGALGLATACQPDRPKAEASAAGASAAGAVADTAYRAYPAPTSAAAFTIRHPAWAERASIYEVNIRQYSPEGTFRAFEKHLPRLQQMGVGILWLMPIHPIGEKNRKGTLGSYYSVRDFRAVNSDMGTLADLRHLVAEAHKRGMHVILDWVANHTAWDNPLVQQHPDWYTRDAQGQLVPPVADWQDVVDLDYSKPELRAWMTESMAYWVREADVDGFRCDVAGLVPTEFWNDTRVALEKIKPVFMLAEWDELHHPPFVAREDWNPNTRLLEKAFDATYALKLHGILDSIGKGQASTDRIDAYLALERRTYPPHVRLMNFTSSHDINSWDGTEYERLGKNAQAEAVLTTLLPGIPMVYSGQESAVNKRLSFFEKDPIEWKDYPLGDFYENLLDLKGHPALGNFDSTSIFARLASPTGTYAFSRSKGDKAVLVSVNLSDTKQSVVVPVLSDTSRWWICLGEGHDNGHGVQRTGADYPLELPAHGYQVCVSFPVPRMKFVPPTSRAGKQ